MSFSTPIVTPAFQIKTCITKHSKKEEPYSEKEKQLLELTIQIQKLKINTFYNRDKRVFVKAYKQQFPKLTIKTICDIVCIKVSTYYYKPKRQYFQGYVHERRLDPIQFSQFQQTLKAYNLPLLDNTCKRALAKAFKSKFPLLTTTKICQMLLLRVSTYYAN